MPTLKRAGTEQRSASASFCVRGRSGALMVAQHAGQNGSMINMPMMAADTSASSCAAISSEQTKP